MPIDNVLKLYSETIRSSFLHYGFWDDPTSIDLESITLQKIKDAQKAAEKINTWNKDFSKRQKNLLLEYKIELNVDSNMLQRTRSHQAVMNYYYEVALNELKVQAFVDDFIDAFNASEKDKIKASQASLKAQIILSNKFMNASKPYKNDDSLLKSSGKVLGFYKKLSLGLIEDEIIPDSFKYPEYEIAAYFFSTDLNISILGSSGLERSLRSRSDGITNFIVTDSFVPLLISSI